MNEQLYHTVVQNISIITKPEMQGIHIGNFFNSHEIISIHVNRNIFVGGTVGGNKISKCPLMSSLKIKTLGHGFSDCSFYTKKKKAAAR